MQNWFQAKGKQSMRGCSSLVQHLTAEQDVPGSNPGIPLPNLCCKKILKVDAQKMRALMHCTAGELYPCHKNRYHQIFTMKDISDLYR